MPVILYECIVRHALALGNAGTGGSYHSSSFVMDTRTQNMVAQQGISLYSSSFIMDT